MFLVMFAVMAFAVMAFAVMADGGGAWGRGF